MTEDEDSLSEKSDDEKQGAASVDDKGDVEMYVERGNDSPDDEDPVDSAEEVDQDDNQNLSPGGISYTSRLIPSKRCLRDVITETPRAILYPWSKKANFEALISEEILRTILIHTDKKLLEIRRSLHVRYPTTLFSMEELKAELTIILRAGRDKDNFSNLEGFSKPFYRTVMSLNRFKLLLWCLRFDKWYTYDERKLVYKFAAVCKTRNIFLQNARGVYIPRKCITVNEQLVGYRDRIAGRAYMPSKPRKYGLKIF